jgi:psiF repeat
LSVRGVFIAAACVVLAGGGAVACAADAATPTVVTARPPLEAVPATPGAPAHQSRLRRCAAAARAKHLSGQTRESYVKSCTSGQHPIPAKAAR